MINFYTKETTELFQKTVAALGLNVLPLESHRQVRHDLFKSIIL
jgi:hypothetical protein